MSVALFPVMNLDICTTLWSILGFGDPYTCAYPTSHLRGG